MSPIDNFIRFFDLNNDNKELILLYFDLNLKILLFIGINLVVLFIVVLIIC